MQNQEIKMFGCTEEAVVSSFNTAYNINMRLAGMLSDAQECFAHGDVERGNKLLNQVKFYFFEFTDTRGQVSCQKVEA